MEKLDNKNNVGLINVQNGTGIFTMPNLTVSTDWARRAAPLFNIWNPQPGNAEPSTFKTEEGVYLTRMNQGYKYICSSKAGNDVYLFTDEQNKNHDSCKWKYDKNDRKFENNYWPGWCLAPKDNRDQGGYPLGLRKCDGEGDITRWVFSDDLEECKNLGIDFKECKLSTRTDAKAKCKKYTENEICNSSEIENIKKDCKNLGIDDDTDCKKSIIEKVKSYFKDNTGSNKNYSLYKNCDANKIPGKECSQSLIDKCNLYKFNSPGNVVTCNLKSIEDHEKNCEVAGLELSLCTVDKLTKELDRKVIRDGQTISATIAEQALEAQGQNADRFLRESEKLLNGERLSNASSIVRDSMNLDNNTALILGVGLLGAYLMLSE
jgi:hypothetical protein